MIVTMETPARTTKEHKVIPASEQTLATSFPALICDLYARTRDQKLLGTVFPGHGDVTFYEFSQYVARPGNFLAIGWVEDSGTKSKVAGYGFLYDYHGQFPNAQGTAGYCFFKEWWGSEEIVEIAINVVDYWFLSGFKAIYGTILESNRLGRAFDRKIGFKEVGKLPNYFYRDGRLQSGVMYVKERQEVEGG